MGARIYIIKEVEANKFAAVYNHWGADRIHEWAMQGMDKATLYERLEELYRVSINEEEANRDKPLIYDLNDIKELYKFIDFKSIGIEIYPILWLGGEMTIFLTLIRNYVNGAIRYESKKEKNPWALSWAFQEKDNAEAIIDFLDVTGYKNTVAEKLIRSAWVKMRKNHMTNFELIIADNLYNAVKKGYTLPLRSIDGLIYY